MTRVAWHLALVLAACSSILSGCSDSASAGDAVDGEGTMAVPRGARVARVEMREMAVGLSANGVLSPVETVSVTSDIPGVLVRKVMAEAGTAVEAGQVLVQLDGQILDAQIAQVRAKVARMTIEAKQAREESATSASLSGKRVIAEEAIAARKYRSAAAQAALDMAQAELKELTLRRSRMALRAPVSGMVVERNVAVGDLTGSSPRPMLSIVPYGGTQLKADIPETRLGDLPVGTPATVTLADGRSFNGKVSRIGGRVQAGTALAEVYVSIGQPLSASNSPLRVGMSGTVEFALTAQSVSAVPEKAVIYSPSGSSVMVLDNDNRARRIKVATGQRADGYVQLVEGPPPGATVVLGAAAFVAEGDKVDPVQPASTSR